jgi:hypothetical protein
VEEGKFVSTDEGACGSEDSDISIEINLVADDKTRVVRSELD